MAFSKTEKLYLRLLGPMTILSSFLLGIPALPLGYLIYLAWDMTESIPLIVFLTAFSYLSYPMGLMITVVTFKRLLRLKVIPGTYKIGSWGAIYWAFITALITLVRFAGNLEFLRSTPMMVLYLRGMGAKIGKDVIMNTAKVYDMDILEVGNRTVIGGDVVLMGHSGERGELIIRPVKIGNNCSIGHTTTILGGAEIGDNVVVGAMSLVPKDAKLPPNTIWGGVPVREIGKKQC